MFSSKHKETVKVLALILCRPRARRHLNVKQRVTRCARNTLHPLIHERGLGHQAAMTTDGPSGVLM